MKSESWVTRLKHRVGLSCEAGRVTGYRGVEELGDTTQVGRGAVVEGVVGPPADSCVVDRASSC